MNLKNIFFFEIQVATSFPRILYCVDFGTGTQKWNSEKQIFFAYDISELIRSRTAEVTQISIDDKLKSSTAVEKNLLQNAEFQLHIILSVAAAIVTFYLMICHPDS